MIDFSIYKIHLDSWNRVVYLCTSVPIEFEISRLQSSIDIISSTTTE
jgi:hypothetical protein